LNIGTGMQFLKGYFKNFNKLCRDVNVEMVDLDYDENLGPDIIADLREGIPLKEKFDIVICCQVLQYINYRYFGKVLGEFSRVCKNNGRVILSMTDSGYYVFIESRIPKLFKKLFFNFNLLLPKVHSKSIETWGKDYWEINRKYRIFNFGCKLLTSA
jgi:SAM-dependent methyltransferase